MNTRRNGVCLRCLCRLVGDDARRNVQRVVGALLVLELAQQRRCAQLLARKVAGAEAKQPARGNRIVADRPDCCDPKASRREEMLGTRIRVSIVV